MIVTERQTWAKYDLANKPKPILTKVCDQENFKFILKGLTAKNTAVLDALIKLLAETQNIAIYQDLIDQLELVQSLAKQYQSTDDWKRKRQLLRIISELSFSQVNAEKFWQLNFPIFVIKDFVKCTQGENLTHENL